MIQVQNDQEYCTLCQTNQADLHELSRKSDVPEENEVNACLIVLYGYMLLKLKNSEISEQTQKTVQRISRQIGHLSARYIQFEKDEFEF
jgi:very-short-patch-repair endonuclease